MKGKSHPTNDVSLNPSGNTNIRDVIDTVDASRRRFVQGSVGSVALATAGGLSLGGVALVGALGWWGWDSYQSNRAAKGAEAYDRGLEALRESKPADARAAFQEAV